jgi:hypothetical protein
VFITYQPLLADDPANDARAVFVAFVKAAKDKNMEQFKSYIAKEDLKEMEKEGFVDLMMAIMADETPNSYKSEATGNQVIFKKEIKETSAEGSVTGSSTVYMVKEEGNWKFGKPRN